MDNLCYLCKKSNAKYSCPRCNIIYCSVPCYQSSTHLECSEEFYKSCIQEELHLQDDSEESKKKMLEILQRYQLGASSSAVDDDEGDDQLDSDDDEEVASIAERLEGVDLDNADEIWTKLTNDEKQDFLAFIQSKDVTNLIPSWEPWWLYSASKVEELAISEQYKQKCPNLVTIKNFNKISTKPPADCVQYNLCNILAAYVFTMRYFNGEHQDFSKEVASCIINLSATLKNNQNFNEMEMAIKSVTIQILECNWIIADEENLKLIETDTIRILKGPSSTDQKYYIKSALSDFYKLLNDCIKCKETDDKKSNFNKSVFGDSFPKCNLVPNDKMKLVLRKIEYYLAFVKDCLDLNNLIN